MTLEDHRCVARNDHSPGHGARGQPVVGGDHRRDVEDDRALARVLADNLTFCGFDVECASDGDVALARLQAFAPDLVLLDVGHNGFELCGLMRQRGRTPIIILTA